ncbi:nucleotidyltransferase family protein [Desulfobacula sp.]|uniref:nucleotidyltransferase family protein n=1 Tax=Desulfobacula sp. TaxID=2593537 RepID=UPI001EBEAAF8|nr:nucleotidyltransferase family protein [Desulfobacula sp.]
MHNAGASISKLTGVILAGGLGTRLRDTLPDRPKVMGEINGRPFISFLLDQLYDAKIKKVVLCTGYMAKFVESLLGDTYKDLEIIYSMEHKPLGTGGALKLAGQYLDGDSALVMNGDSFVECDVQRLLSWHVKKKASVSIVLACVDNVSRFGSIKINTGNEVTRFVEKGNVSDAGLINAGVYLMQPEAVDAIPCEKPFSLEKQYFPSLVGSGLYGYQTSGRFIDIGTPESFVKAQSFFS